jgi:acyl-CoA synthetase (AMP-forming)/AMP-acid ligase II
MRFAAELDTLSFSYCELLWPHTQELERASSYLAETLVKSHKLAAGDRVLLVFFPGLDFTVSLLACFKAGLVGVPVFPPDPRKMKKDLHHFMSIQRNCGAKTALTNSLFSYAKKVEGLKSMFSSEGAKWPELNWVTVDDILKKGKGAPAGKASGATLPAITLDTIAFLQYTSGSTSDPKGVMISHRNLAHNLTLIIQELKADQSTVNVSWLPQYHDMGLIGKRLEV